MNTNFKNILCYILESVILAAFVIFVLICFLFLLSPNLQWMFLLFLVIIPLILAFFAIIEGSYDVYITVLNRKKYNTKPKETKKHFISILPNFSEPFNKYLYYSYENYNNISEDENLFFIYTLFKASLFSKFYLVIIRIINKLHKDNFIEKENINQN